MILTRVANVELLVYAISLHLGDQQSLVDVLVAKVRPCGLVYVLFIAVVKIDAFVIDEVLRLLVLCIGRSVVWWVCRCSGLLRILGVHEFDLDLVNVPASIGLLVESLILSFVIEAPSLLEVIVLCGFGLVCSFLVLGLVPLVSLGPLGCRVFRGLLVRLHLCLFLKILNKNLCYKFIYKFILLSLFQI